ncbi:hypothetical protein [Bacteriovorax sp. Seq25_V]|uniref:hypothetical protein n=1 Tax=Bacteriovorax sp. Seq25_V TaxID=1201288 RepID=UPI000389DE40|nr:hypothetical protein [Bacteriovorax sp. Seq25_V]EQC44790.1 hypothetical protein M900_0381 [Bacteriovorax sp. Seq25_V]
MKVSGFTFIKNGLSLGYPFTEAIESIAPLCDEVVINVGFEDEACTKDDGTYEYLTNKFSDSKYVFLKSYWNPEIQKQGLILSEQTNIALDAITGDYGIYIQGDECLHEKDYESIRAGIRKLEADKSINGLVFNYHHFYGNTNIVKVTKKTYRHEIRLIRNKVGIKSWLDAQGFRNHDDSKIKCFKIDAHIYHYGWARQEQVMSKKTEAFTKLYHGKDFQTEEFHYSRIWGLRAFGGTHPKVMEKWILENTNEIDILSLPLDISIKDTRVILSDFIEYLTNIRIGEYKNFILVS